jgi:hypothetical protein
MNGGATCSAATAAALLSMVRRLKVPMRRGAVMTLSSEVLIDLVARGFSEAKQQP